MKLLAAFKCWLTRCRSHTVSLALGKKREQKASVVNLAVLDSAVLIPWRRILCFTFLSLVVFGFPGVAKAQYRLSYTITNSEITITGYTLEDPSMPIPDFHVTVPSEMYCLPVTSIGDGAFISGQFERITIPNSVRTIG